MERQNSNKIVTWYWNNNDLDVQEDLSWTAYPKENQVLIEKAFSLGKNETELIISDKSYILDFKNTIQFLKSDTTRRRLIKRKESDSNYESEYYWFWECNDNYNDVNPSVKWAPYDISVNHLIEMAFQQKQESLQVTIGKENYKIDLNTNHQILERDIYRTRPIKRAGKNENLNIIRSNRFCSLIDAEGSGNNFFSNYKMDKNIQTLISINEFLKTNSLIENNIFKAKICLPNDFIDYLVDKLRYLKIKDMEELKDILKEEISNEASNIINISSKLHNSKYLSSQAEYYLKIVDKFTLENMEEILIRLYTEEGFLSYSINSVLKEKTLSQSRLCVYFLLLQSALIQVGSKFNLKKIRNYSLESLNNGKTCINLYRGAKLDKELFNNHLEILNEKEAEGIFMIFNEFLSTTHDKDIAIGFATKGDIKKGLVRVLYRIQLDMDDLFNNPNIICFIEDLSRFPWEKEVLFSSSCNFRIVDIQSNEDYNEITLMFTSNGYNLYDFIKYSTLQKINLQSKNIKDQEAYSIAEGLKINSNCLKINLQKNHIEIKGIRSIADVLKINNCLQEIILNYNKIGDEGARIIAEAIKVNFTLQLISLIKNNIGDEGIKFIAEALKNNYKSNLKKISLQSNYIGDEGVQSIHEAIKEKEIIEVIDLHRNKIKILKKQKLLDKRILY